MPLSKYYGGHGEKVMESMKKQYGKDKGEKVFYATANSSSVGPSKKLRRKHGV